MARVLADEQGGPVTSFAQIPVAVFAVTGLLVVIWALGVRWLVRDPAGRLHRWLLVVGVFAAASRFAATGGKPYYAAPRARSDARRGRHGGRAALARTAVGSVPGR